MLTLQSANTLALILEPSLNCIDGVRSNLLQLDPSHISYLASSLAKASPVLNVSEQKPVEMRKVRETAWPKAERGVGHDGTQVEARPSEIQYSNRIGSRYSKRAVPAVYSIQSQISMHMIRMVMHARLPIIYPCAKTAWAEPRREFKRCRQHYSVLYRKDSSCLSFPDSLMTAQKTADRILEDPSHETPGTSHKPVPCMSCRPVSGKTLGPIY